MSYAELEFNTATEAGLERLMFLVDTEADNVGIPLSALVDREFGTRQDAFRRRVQESGLVTRSFASPAKLGQLVERSLGQLAVRREDMSSQRPESGPAVWNIPARNLGFTGRGDLLATLRERLMTKDRAVVQALHGMGGVGKTQLVVEYAHRFAASYDLAWWVAAEQDELIGDQFVTLAAALGCIQGEGRIDAVRAMILAKLRERDRWLLVFDNAKSAAGIRPWLPAESGHVLITSRERDWTEIAEAVEVDVMARDESVAMLQARVSGLADVDANQLADQLGDLPLAIAQAAGFMVETGMSAAEYVELLRTRAAHLLDQGTPGSYGQSLVAAIELIIERLVREDPAAAELANLCAFLAPDPIPEDLLAADASSLSSDLAARVSDRLAWRRTLGRLTRQSLVRVDERTLQMHRLTQAILRSHLSSELAAVIQSRVEAIVGAYDPGDPDVPDSWPGWARLMPHLLALDPVASSIEKLRDLACQAASYLIGRGDVLTGYDLAACSHQQWRDRLGPDHRQTLWVAGVLASAAREMGHYDEARDLDDDILTRRRRLLGEDHSSTLNSATNLALDLSALGETQAARELGEDTLVRKRRNPALGEDHPSTLSSANNLAIVLSTLGETRAARDLNQDTLARRRRVLGEDHPRTLDSAYNLTLCLYELSDYRTARELAQDTLDRRRRVLGDDHPSTLLSANHLAADLHALGEFKAARDLDRDTLERRRRVLGQDHPGTLVSASNLAEDLRALGELEAARDLHRETLDTCRRVLGDEHRSTLASANNLAEDLRALGQYQTARELDEITLRQFRRVLGEDHPTTLVSANNLGEDLRALGELEAARDLHRETLDTCRRVLGDEHRSTLASANNLAVDLHALGDYRAARELDVDTLEQYRRVLGEDHRRTLASAGNLAADLYTLGDLEAARDLHQDVLGRYRRVLGADHPDTLRTANNLAVDLRELGDYQAARELDEDTLHQFRRVLGEDHPSTLASADNLAADLHKLGNLEAARDLHQDVLGRYRRVLGADHPDTLGAANNLAEDLRALGETKAARDLHQDVLGRYRRVLGADHPDTLRAADGLAEDLRLLGDDE